MWCLYVLEVPSPSYNFYYFTNYNLLTYICYPELDKKERSLINQLRIEQIHPTHSFMKNQDEPPLCDTCGVLLTVNQLPQPILQTYLTFLT